jgi:hypothetical protein
MKALLYLKKMEVLFSLLEIITFKENEKQEKIKKRQYD